MKVSFVEELVCPISGESLKLLAFDTEEIGDGSTLVPVVRNGILVSASIGVWYPISNYVPVLLVFPTPFHARFEAANRSRILEAGRLRMPYLECEPGETFVQRSFTEEWDLTQESELSFVRSKTDLVNLNKYVWLKWLGADRPVGRCLNVGCGIGKETLALSEVTRAREIVAVDLNFAVLQAGARHKSSTHIEFVMCSLFHMPFRKSSFDLVYSQGVIHHTYSTYDAFRSIAEFVRDSGFLFTWVYALEDHLVERNQFGRTLAGSAKYLFKTFWWWMECGLRPWLSRSPAWVRSAVIGLLAALLHPLIKSRVIHKDQWKLMNTKHSLRDVFTPAYAYRHSFNEVIDWYEANGFVVHDVQSAHAHMAYFDGKKIHGIGMTGRKRPALAD